MCGTLRLDPHPVASNCSLQWQDSIAPQGQDLCTTLNALCSQRTSLTTRTSKLIAFRSGECLLTLRELTPATWSTGHNHLDTEGPLVDCEQTQQVAGFTALAVWALIMSLKPWRPHWGGGAPARRGYTGRVALGTRSSSVASRSLPRHEAPESPIPRAGPLYPLGCHPRPAQTLN